MRQAPLHGHRDGSEHVVPGGVKRLGHRRPAQPPGPDGQKPRVGRRELVLALGPGNGLDSHAASATLHAVSGVQKEDGEAPQGHELEAPRRQRVVARAGLLTPRAARPAMGPRAQFDLEVQPSGLFAEPDGTVHEPGLLLEAIQDSLHLHPVLDLLSKLAGWRFPSSQRSGTGCARRGRALGDAASPRFSHVTSGLKCSPMYTHELLFNPQILRKTHNL